MRGRVRVVRAREGAGERSDRDVRGGGGVRPHTTKPAAWANRMLRLKGRLSSTSHCMGTCVCGCVGVGVGGCACVCVGASVCADVC